MFPRRSSRTGTVLIFLLATMAIVTVMLRSITKVGETPAALSSAREHQLIAKALALSGFDLMSAIADHNSGTEDGPTFLKNRQRDLKRPATGYYDFPSLFQLSTSGTTYLNYTPPVSYPPLKDVCLNTTPYNSPNGSSIMADTDIQLPDTSISLYSTEFLKVPNTAVGSSSASLPRTNALPEVGALSDPYYDYTSGNGLLNATNAGGLLINALQTHDTAANTIPVLPWAGPDSNPNTGATCNYVPQVLIIQNAGSYKMPPPSLIFPRDISPNPSNANGHYRGFIYGWYVRSPSNTKNWYYMTSGRVRVVYGSGSSETLGSEVCASDTQLR